MGCGHSVQHDLHETEVEEVLISHKSLFHSLVLKKKEGRLLFEAYEKLVSKAAVKQKRSSSSSTSGSRYRKTSSKYVVKLESTAVRYEGTPQLSNASPPLWVATSTAPKHRSPALSPLSFEAALSLYQRGHETRGCWILLRELHKAGTVAPLLSCLGLSAGPAARCRDH